MRQKILAAVTASALAWACTEDAAKQAALPPPNKPAPIAVQAQPLAAEPSAPAPAVEKERDPLGLAHSHRPSMNHRQRWEELRRLGELDEALFEARCAVADDPADEEALRTIARLARPRSERELAAHAFERLGQLRPEDALPVIQQARILASLADYEGALKLADEATLRDPENPEGFQVMGRAYLGDGQLDQAIACFNKVLELMPDHGYAWNNLGYALLSANRNAEAVDALEQAVMLLPQVAFIHNNLGIALERTGRVEDARFAYARATSLSPRYVKAHVNANRLAHAVPAAPAEGGQDVPTGEPSAVAESSPELSPEE
jgi:tetratricopeptide (TPR) repeat protein